MLRKFISALGFLLAVSGPICGQDHSSGREQSDSAVRQRPSAEEVDRAISLATAYLVRACGPDGKFAYRVEIGSGRESASYDIIRHEGAVYALAMANRFHPDPKVAEAIIRAVGFLRQNYAGAAGGPNQLAVWSRPLAESAERQYAELGGAGLGLVALMAARRIDPKSVSLEDLQALGRFILFLQKDDGSFVNKYSLKDGPVPHWESLFYPGEAALGLVALYEADHSSQWLVAAAKALAYLAKSGAGLATVPADHWALIATAKLMPYSDQVQSAVSRDALIRHAIQICDSIVREQFRGGPTARLDGAFDPIGGTAPAATRLEGLLAAQSFLPAGELRDRIETAVERGIGFLLRVQISSGPQAGGMPGAVLNRAVDSGDVRIDYVQHALCAWLNYKRLICSGWSGIRFAVALRAPTLLIQPNIESWLHPLPCVRRGYFRRRKLPFPSKTIMTAGPLPSRLPSIGRCL
jgi:hypothetical protein